MPGFFDDIFDEFFSDDFLEPSRRYVIKESAISPLTDMWQEDDKLIIIVDMPGAKKDNIELYVTETELRLKAKTSNITYYKRLHFPAKVIKEKAKSTFNNGVLEIVIPLKEKMVKIR